MALPGPLRRLRAAAQFLTRVPVGSADFRPEDLAGAPGHFPAVGALLGLAGASLFTLTLGAGPWPAAILATALLLLATGAFHEDGLADTADALGGAFTRERIFEILKDSRIGAFGAAALGVVLLLRVALLAESPSLAAWGLVLSQSWGRLFPVWLMAAMPYVTPADQARSKPLARGGWVTALVATLWAVGVGIAICWAAGWSPARLLPGLGLSVAATLVCAWRFHRRAGGLTGDFLGATEQVCECALLLGLALGSRP